MTAPEGLRRQTVQAPAAGSAPDELDRLASVLTREADRLEAVREELRELVAQTRGEWEGLVADRFRAHTGGGHRQAHLALARDRLRRAARLAREAAEEQRSRCA